MKWFNRLFKNPLALALACVAVILFAGGATYNSKLAKIVAVYCNTLTVASNATVANIHQTGSVHADLKDTTVTGALTVSGALNLTDTGQVFTYLDGKAGATAGWVVRAGADLWQSTLPASQTSSTLVIPLTGLHVGDIITKVNLVGQVESAGGAVQINVELRKLTAAAADVSDATVSDITRMASITADTILSASNSATGTLNETVGADETFYVLITATTAASTDIALQGAQATVTQK
jgi:hypothetical protein